MTTITQGESGTLVATFYSYEGGPLVDLDATPAITITPAAGGAAVIGPTTTGVAHPATGTYTYSWAVDDAQAVGDYIAVWAGLAGGGAVSAVEVVAVAAPTGPSGATWATVADVLAITGQTVTSAQVLAAQSVCELHVNRTPAASGAMTTRDLYWLKQMVAWQAPWQASQPGYVRTLHAAKRITQDGLQLEHESRAEILLCPLAIRAMRNLSWLKTRSTRPASRRYSGDFLSDDNHGWAPL